MDLKGAHVLIVGGSKGVGGALAHEMAARGARLTVLARDSAELRKVAQDTGGLAWPANLTDLDSLDGLIERVEAQNGPVDAIVHNAAIIKAGPFSKISAHDLRAGLTTNLLSHMELCRQTLPGMLERGRGTIAIVGSVSAEVSMIHLCNYAPAKIGLAKFGIDLQRELRGTPISVFVFVLGSVRGTQLSNEGVQDPAMDFIDRRTGDMGVLTPEKVAARMSEVIRSRRRTGVVTIPRIAGLITQFRMLPVKLIDPLLAWPAVAEARRHAGKG